MIGALFEGMLFGLPFVLVVGPALFAILQTSMSKGFYSGMQLALGISLSDSLLMCLCYFGLVKYIQNQTFQMLLGFLGSIFLLIYGIFIFIRKTTRISKKKDFQLKINWLGVFSEVVKGFFLNIMNPFLWILWLTIISSGTATKTQSESLIFIFGIVITIFSFDVLKSFFANKIVKLLSPKVIFKINKITGVILMISSLVLFIRTLFLANLI